MKMPASPSQQPVAFSLVEMLITVAIIGVLSALLAGAIGRGKEAASSVNCLSNLRQLGAAALAFSADNDGLLIPIAGGTSASDAVTWRKILASYVGEGSGAKVFRCSADTTSREQETRLDNYIRPTSYGINNATGLHQYLSTTPASQKLASVRKPSETIFIADIGVVENPGALPEKWRQKLNPGSYGYANFPNHWSWAAGNNWNVFPRHGGKANVLFYDGHTEPVSVSERLIPFPPGHEKCIYDN